MMTDAASRQNKCSFPFSFSIPTKALLVVVVGIAASVLSMSCVVVPANGGIVDSTDLESMHGASARSGRSTLDMPSDLLQPVTSDPRFNAARRLGLPGRFLVGLGNDVTSAEEWKPARAHAYEVGPKLDIHYLYLSGLDWPTWSAPEGAYVTQHAEEALSRGVIPMFTLYQAAARGEANLAAFADDKYMGQYWHNVRVMYQRLGQLGAPSIVHLEPDLWGYFQKQSPSPEAVLVKVSSHVPECFDLPEDVAGFGRCLIRLGRLFAPQAMIGLSASSFGAYKRGNVSDPERIADYLIDIGSDESDIMVVETLDRDAGCFEAASDPLCDRKAETQIGGSFYWNDAAFRAHLRWARTIHERTGKALLWWQMPLGTPSETPGGDRERYRDNRVKWLFEHPEEFVDAGGFGAVFGRGAPNQTTVKTDGGQFTRAVSRYLENAVWF
jgi:hypothetical protein